MSSLYRIRAFQRRTDTLHRRAEALFADLMAEFGAEGMAGGDNITDFADNIVCATSDMLSVLDRLARPQAKASSK